jgi:hypothetical protein
MSLGVVAFAAVFVLALGLLVWRLSTMETHLDGYTILSSFMTTQSAHHALAVVQGAGIAAYLDDHTPSVAHLFRTYGSIHLMVPIPQVHDAERALRRAERLMHAPDRAPAGSTDANPRHRESDA